ncbi:hypothetical protein LZD49_26350 [Dyadobacter sp. CY261]|uniref:hypothetical protein n=1 Tax=Dyadobacter sp. CY261 TaxID=2907203 RepID=UPI001F1C74C8|nr:hypothetical protein [Dyadobacter sp. CY261]MCF0074031.1 hypothetical protein [Dyadobacter sp. CY261]
MKDIIKPLTVGYCSLLDGMVVDGKRITFYDMSADYDSLEPYILLNSIGTNNTNTRDSFDGTAVVHLTVFTAFDGDFGGADLADAIGNEILQRVIPAPGTTNIQAEGFNIMGAKLNDNRDYKSELPDRRIYEKVLVIEHLTEQL